MKQLLLLLFIVGLSCVSCESEYEERLEQGLNLKERLAFIENNSELLESDRFNQEIEEIKNEITLLAKISGNEELFMKQIFAD